MVISEQSCGGTNQIAVPIGGMFRCSLPCSGAISHNLSDGTVGGYDNNKVEQTQ